MEKLTLNVNGMSCQHCVRSVEKALNSLGGISDVVVDLNAKTVTANHDPAKTSADKIRAAIEDQGFDVLPPN